MEIIFFNSIWMAFNLYLAILPVIFSLFLFKMPNMITKLIVGLLWFFYLPNTIYVITDIQHIFRQWSFLTNLERFIVFLQYLTLEIIGIYCFLIAFYPFERILDYLNIKSKMRIAILIALNFVMGFAIVLGRFERVNSWEIFTNPMLIINSTIHILTTIDMFLFTIFFGIISSFFYLVFKNLVIMKWIRF